MKMLKIFGAILVAGTLAAGAVAGTQNPVAGTESSENLAGTDEEIEKMLFPSQEKLREQIAEWQAQEDDPEVQLRLAVLYADTCGPIYNKTRAEAILRNLAARGNARAQFLLATQREIMPSNRPIRELLFSAALNNYVPAMREYAHQRKFEGDPDGEYQGWILRAAEAGDSQAQLEVAKAFEAGTDFERDSKLAFSWFKKAAESGDGEALFGLGNCYENGIGVEKNLDEAQKCYRKAIVQNSWQAWERMKQFFAAGTPNPRINFDVFDFLGVVPGGSVPADLGKNWEHCRRSKTGSSEDLTSLSTDVDFWGKTWWLRIEIDARGNAKQIHLQYNFEKNELRQAAAHYKEIAEKFTEKNRDFLVTPSQIEREKNVIFETNLDSPFYKFPRAKTEFFDGRTTAYICISDGAVFCDFSIRSENWEREFKECQFVPKKFPVPVKAETKEIKRNFAEILEADLDLDEIVEFFVENRGCRCGNAEDYAELEFHAKSDALHYVKSAEKYAEVIRKMVEKCPSDDELARLKSEYETLKKKFGKLDFDVPADVEKYRELISAKIHFLYARSIRKFFEYQDLSDDFLELMMKNYPNDCKKWLELFEKSQFSRVDFEKLSDKYRFYLVKRDGYSEWHYGFYDDSGRNVRLHERAILREIIQLEQQQK